MKLLGRISDSMLGRLVPKAAAQARICEQVFRSYCSGVQWIECAQDICNGNKFLGCKRTGRC